ncbi:MAG: pyruvate, phosphate dikinase, partial [Methanobacteriota archaeon]
PGMMDTVLNLGLNDQTVSVLAALAGDERFAWDAYRRLVQMYGRIVMRIEAERFDAILEAWKAKTDGGKDTDLTTDMLKAIVLEYKQVYRAETKAEFPQKPVEQLRQAVVAVFGSWMGKRAIDYRRFAGIPDDLGTAANVQTMVFGNLGGDSGTGVAFTRDPATGAKGLYGEYLAQAQGEDVVAGIRTPLKIAVLRESHPATYEELDGVAAKLEAHYHDMQDMEFTVERGKFWMLQTRTGKRTAQAAVRIAVDMVKEGLIRREEAVLRIEPPQVIELLMPRFHPEDRDAATRAGRLLGKGVNASPGAAAGVAVLDSDLAETLGSRRFRLGENSDFLAAITDGVNTAKRELGSATGLPWISRLTPEAFVIRTDKGRWVEFGQLRDVLKGGERERPVELRLKVLMTRTETSPEDVHGMLHAKGILTARGGATAHASVVARGLGIPCVVGCEALHVNYETATFALGGKSFAQGDYVSIDGATGEVFADLIPAMEPDFEKEDELRTILDWCDSLASPFMVWANADYPRDARRARTFGAKGVGLCRTEHMFFETERLPIVHEMILNAVASRGKENEEARRRYLAALAKLGEFQTSDFADIFRAMAGLPVVIRLIDPPLHEFLPKYEDLLVELTEMRLKGGYATAIAEKEEMLRAVEATKEANPMLGLRGCRLGIMFPEITEMQVRAIFDAAIAVKKEGGDVHPEIMIPLVGHVNELRNQREALEAVAKATIEARGLAVDYKFGTMIEVPRGALTADEIARYAEFFSFGTNDLTQMTFGYSRDDAEGKFLMKYVADGILPYNPFQTLDGIPANPKGQPRGVAELIATAVTLGRKTRPDLKVGICGEHGGDPASIAYCHARKLNYVSCSPFRVPVARLAAARAAVAATTTVARDK